MVKVFLLVCCLCSSLCSADLPEFSLDKFTFFWNIVNSDGAELCVLKTNDNSVIYLKESGSIPDSIVLSASEAEGIGQALSQVDRFYNTMKNSKEDCQESVEAGNYNVLFFFHSSSGFNINIRKNETFSLDTIAMDRLQAKAFYPYLMRADALISFVDKKFAYGFENNAVTEKAAAPVQEFKFATDKFGVTPAETGSDLNRRLAASGIAELAINSGVFVDDIALGSLAHQSGLQKFDIITEVNNNPIPDIFRYQKELDSLPPDQPILLTIKRLNHKAEDETKPWVRLQVKIMPK